MENEKIITHVEISINPVFLEEVLQKAKVTRDAILLEEGTESFTLTRKKEEPNTLVIFAIYKSKELYDWHLEQAYVKSFFELLNGKLLSTPITNRLEAI